MDTSTRRKGVFQVNATIFVCRQKCFVFFTRIMTDNMKNSLIDVIVGAMIVAISDNCDDYDDF